MLTHDTVVDASAPADVQPVFGAQDELTALVLRLVRSAPLTGMGRAQIVYTLRAHLGAAGLHVGTNDLIEFVEQIIRRETTKHGCVVDRDGLNAQAACRARSVPPTGRRLTNILDGLRVLIRSVAGQIGPAAVLEFVKETLRQDFEIQEEWRNG